MTKRGKKIFALRFISLWILIATAFSLSSCGEDGVFGDVAGEDDLVTSYTFENDDSRVVNGGYYSGTSTPSISFNLSEAFDLRALAKNKYVCNINVSYFCQVQGDHLNVRCTMSGVTDLQADYTYLNHNEGATLSFDSYNISPSSYSNNSVLNLKWDCKGITFLDGINSCKVSNVVVTVTFAKN